MCGHLEMVGWPLNVEACMERFFGMAEVLVVGERKKKAQGNCSLDLNATGARGCLGGCHITDLLPCTQWLLQRKNKEQLQRTTELKYPDMYQQCMGSQMKSAGGEML